MPIGLGALWLGLRDKRIRGWLKTSKLFYLILVYVLLNLVMGVVALIRHEVNDSALIYALLINLRFPIFFVICLLITAHNGWLQQHWQKILLLPALLVIVFGLLQHFVLPADALRHVGYGPDTIVAYQAVDLKQNYVRVQSTLRGPNPLGAYLILIITTVVSLFIAKKKQRVKWGTYVLAAGLVLFFTYSRSGWAGTLFAVLLVVWWGLKNPKLRRWLAVGISVFVLMGAGSIVALRHNDYVQNTLFHTDEHSSSAESSNQERKSNLKSAAKDIAREPLGRGPGTAGPASVRNNHPARIAENYYLQIGQEVGILGLIVFLAINIVVALELWRQRDKFSLILLASLAGITIVNMLSHAWADDTLSLLWWGLAGIALGSGILNKIANKNETKTQTTKRNHSNS